MRWLFLFGLLLTLFGCGESMPQEYPTDFTLRYDWREGTVAPPYHYEYTITLDATGQGQIVYRPDYAATPEWTEPFTVGSDLVQNIYSLMLQQAVFSASWEQENPPPVGGSNAWLETTASGKTYRVPAELIPAQSKRIEPVYTAIEQLVPAAIWQQLSAQRQQYIDEQQ